MQPCHVSITTCVDETENTITRKGMMQLSVLSAQLYYREENAEVTILLKKDGAFIERRGDYNLKLTLKKGKVCDGAIGIGGNEGAVQTFTHKIAYSTGKDSLLLSLHYDLIIGNEIQKMKLRLLAKQDAETKE